MGFFLNFFIFFFHKRKRFKRLSLVYNKWLLWKKFHCLEISDESIFINLKVLIYNYLTFDAVSAYVHSILRHKCLCLAIFLKILRHLFLRFNLIARILRHLILRFHPKFANIYVANIYIANIYVAFFYTRINLWP